MKNFLSRHRRKIFGITLIVGGAVIGSRYAQRRFIEWQEKETKEFLDRTKKQQYFESSEKTCNQTILALSKTLRENILTLLNCEKIIEQLREGSSNKVELWQELKILVFTKVSMLIYCGTLLVIALRIQLNIIGGHIYCSGQEPTSDFKITKDLQEKYLSKCNHFLNEGIGQLLPLVQEKVQSALKDVPLTQSLNLQQLENIFWGIQTSINIDSRSPLKNMPRLLYGYDLGGEDVVVQDIMKDTVELLKCPEVLDIASSCISRGFSNLVDKIAEFFLPQENGFTSIDLPGTSKSCNVRFSHPNNVSKALAKIIPIVNGFGNPGTFDVPEAWISPFIHMDRVKTLGANIYESYCCPKPK